MSQGKFFCGIPAATAASLCPVKIKQAGKERRLRRRLDNGGMRKNAERYSHSMVLGGFEEMS